MLAVLYGKETESIAQGKASRIAHENLAGTLHTAEHVVIEERHNTDIMPYTEGVFLIAFSTLIIPAFDVVRVVLVRIREGHSPFEPDKNHIHHKLLAIGLSPRRAMQSLLSMSCAFSAANILLVPYINNTVLLIADIVIWVGLNLWWDYLRDRK